MANLESYKNVWVFAEQRQGKLMNVALELVGEGHKLSREISDKTKVCAVLVGNKVDHLADELFAYGADCVYLLEDELLAQYTTDGYAKAMTDACSALPRWSHRWAAPAILYNSCRRTPRSFLHVLPLSPNHFSLQLYCGHGTKILHRMMSARYSHMIR